MKFPKVYWNYEANIKLDAVLLEFGCSLAMVSCRLAMVLLRVIV